MKKIFTKFVIKSVLLLLVVSATQAQIPTNGLVASYLFTGNAKDSSGNANDGSFTGLQCNICGSATVTVTPTYTSDRFENANSAYQFYTPYNFISVPNSANLQISNNFTISMWLNPNTGFYGSVGSSQYVIMAKWGNVGAASYQISLDASGKPIIYLHNGSATNSAVGKTAVPMHLWTNIVFTKSADTVRIYNNGVLDTLKTGCYNPLVVNNTLEIGRVFNAVANYNSDRYFGILDDVLIYNRKLDSLEVKSLYIANNGPWILPLNLTTFNAKKGSENINISWQTANEFNTSHFIIQRSVDGTNFSDIGKVSAKGDGGYTFIDNQLPNATVVYYRLQMVDKDGSFTYSKIVSCQLSVASKSLAVYPNPVKGNLFVQITSTKAEKITLQVTDLQGKLLQQEDTQVGIGNVSLSVNTSALAKGSYVLLVKGSGGVQQKQFVKE